MGSIIRFGHPRPLIRIQQKPAAEREARDAERSLFILIGSFFATAILMCAIVVVMLSKTWTDLIVISAFVFVFAVVKIGLANALIYVMVRFDNERANAVPANPSVRLTTYRKVPPRGRPPVAAKTGRLTLAPAHPRPETPGSG